MNRLYVIDYHYPAPDKPKLSCFKNCSYFFYLSDTYGDNQVGQTLFVHSTAGGQGELQDYILLPTLECLGVLGRFCTLECSHITSPSFSPTKEKGLKKYNYPLKSINFN